MSASVAAAVVREPGSSARASEAATRRKAAPRERTHQGEGGLRVGVEQRVQGTVGPRVHQQFERFVERHVEAAQVDVRRDELDEQRRITEREVALAQCHERDERCDDDGDAGEHPGRQRARLELRRQARECARRECREQQGRQREAGTERQRVHPVEGPERTRRAAGRCGFDRRDREQRDRRDAGGRARREQAEPVAHGRPPEAGGGAGSSKRTLSPARRVTSTPARAR